MKTLGELATLVQGELLGNGAATVTGVAGLHEAGTGQLSFFGNRKYKQQFEASKATAILVGLDGPATHATAVLIRVANPPLAFARIASVFAPVRTYAPGVSPQAFVHASAKVPASATVMAHAYVSEGAVVGERVVLYPGVFVGADARIGDDSILYSNASIADRCIVGARNIIHSSAVVGADGFGFAFDPEKPEHFKIPQAGIARLEDDVELGACSCIDRATMGETVVGRGSKIDNLVQVAHNCVVGPYSILCAQVGLSGTTELGTGVVLGGQVGVAGHLRIGDMAKVGAQAGVMADVDDGAAVVGAPAMPIKDFFRSTAVFVKLPEMQKELRDLRKRLAALEEGKKP